VIDGMVLVQEMGKPPWNPTCDDLPYHFCAKIKQKTSMFDEIHIVLGTKRLLHGIPPESLLQTC
jgi:hypothetical protein